MEVMTRLDTVERESRHEIIRLNDEISALKKDNCHLHEENQLLKDDNARLRSIINNDSPNTSLPPSADQKGGKPTDAYNSRQHTGRKAGGQKGHKGTTLTKAEVEEKIRPGKCRHEIRGVGDPSSRKYASMQIRMGNSTFRMNAGVMWFAEQM